MPQPAEVERIRDELLELYRQAQESIDAQLAAIAGEQRRAVLRQRLRRLSREVDELTGQADVQARAWLQQRYPEVYALGGADAAASTGSRFAWTQVHTSAVTALATDTYDDLLGATRFMRRDAKRFIRSAARAAARGALLEGQTAIDAGSDLAAALRERFGIDGIAAVRYKNGARHTLGDYADTVLRTKTAQAYNVGTLTQSVAAGVAWFEVFDGPDCGWTRHDDSDKANGTVRSAEDCANHQISHPRCARSFGPRPDVVTADEAAAADRFPDAERQRLASEERERARERTVTGRLTAAERARRRRAAASGRRTRSG